MSHDQCPIIFLVGPTAVGKTDIAVALAQRLKGEIVSCDSMQVYKGLDIASSKPPPQYLKKVPHHLINIVPLSRDFDVSQFNRRANPAIKKIRAKKKIPLVVGGSGLYMQILLDGLFKGAPKNEALRARLYREAEDQSPEKLYQRLKKLDPAAALKIHPNNTKRIVRALEVCLMEDEPISTLAKNRKGLWGRHPITVIALNRSREELYNRINRRVDEMFREGVVDEVKKIKKKKLSQTVKQLIGIKEIVGYLNGEYDLERAQYLMKRNTRHFAKRQLTWFRKDKRLVWLTIGSKDSKEKVVRNILKILK